MAAVYRNGKWIDDAEEEKQQQPLAAPIGLDIAGRNRWEQEQSLQAGIRQGEAAAAAGGDQRPFWATDLGMAASDTGKVLANAVVGLGTDYADLAAGVGDLVVQAGSLATGNGWDWNKVMDDSDNPWTQWRRETFRTESQAGQAISNLTRIGTMMVALPKVGLKGLAMPFKAAGRVGALGEVGEAAKGIGNLFTKLDDLANAKQAGKVGARLEALEKTFQKKTAASKAAGRALRNDWLGLTYADISRGLEKAPELKGVADWFDNVKTSTKALTQLSKGTPGAKIRSISEALAWDAFAAFNVYGEGDAQFDETLGDWAMSSGMPWLQQVGSLTSTVAEDNGMIRKGKQMLEGVATGVVLSGALDMARVYRYAKNFKAATPEQRRLIVEAMNLNADEIGGSIGKTLSAGREPVGLLAPEAQDAARLRSLDQLYAQVDQQRQQSSIQQDWMAERVRQQAAAQARGVPRLTGGPDDLNSPVQNRLAQMDGLASAFDEDPLYQEWLIQRVPTDELMPPAIGGNPALEQFRNQGPMPTGAPVQNDAAAYKAWLEEKARLPDAELDPRVQQSLRRLEGIGELAPVQPGVGGALGQPAAVEPVQITDLRPPEPTVTPDTIRSAFQRDAYRAFTQSLELTFEEGPDGVMRSMAEQTRQLMPRTRVDALEYLLKFRPAANEYGVINAADSVWTNFIYDRGLAEGWATIDPDTFSIKFNRKAAAELDRGQAALKQAEALDEAETLARYNAVDIEETFKAAQQENPLEIDAAQTARLAEAELDPAKELATRDAIKAGIEADGIDNYEELRLSEADAAKLGGAMGDEEVVREMLGTTLDSVDPATVEKAASGRGWVVFDRNGEVLGTARTRGAAQKIADQQAKRDRDALLARARQMEADGIDEVVDTAVGDPIYDSDIVGRIKLTDAQIAAVQGIVPQLDGLLDEAWVARRGKSAFFNINELGPQKRTFELTQGDMRALQDGIRNAMEAAGPLKGSPRLRALRNLADKLDTEMKLIEPQARAERFVNDLTANTSKYIDHGEFCDFF